MLKKILTAIVILCAVIGVIFYEINRLFPAASTMASQIILQQTSPIEETNGRTNILLLGTGGANHDGPNLTDTIIFASINAKDGKVNLISLPRDLWVDEVGNSGGKINEAYADGELNNQHKGLILVKTLVEKIVGQPVHYGFRIDFDGFVKAVDLVGGLDVQVDNTLDDYQYPIEGKEDEKCGHSDDEVKNFTATQSSELQFFPCRYKHLHVDKGVQHMDGATALQFVRSRHAAGQEGSDFARSHRQQEVIIAFREKLFSVGTIFNPSKVTGLIDILKASIDTDIPQEDYVAFAKFAQQLKGSHIDSSVIDFGDEANNRYGLLIQPPISAQYGFASTLLPRTGEGNYSEIQKYVACKFAATTCTIGKNPGDILTPTLAPTK